MKARIKATNEVAEILFAEVWTSGEYKAFHLNNKPEPYNKFYPEEVELIESLI